MTSAEQFLAELNDPHRKANVHTVPPVVHQVAEYATKLEAAERALDYRIRIAVETGAEWSDIARATGNSITALQAEYGSFRR